MIRWHGEEFDMTDSEFNEWRWREIVRGSRMYWAYSYARATEEARKSWLAHWNR